MITKAQIEAFAAIETPFYFYDMDLLRQTLDIYKQQIDQYGWHAHYAMKANANDRILATIRDYGLGADCVSGNEVKLAVRSGFDPQKIVYAGVGKSDKEIKAALRAGIFSFNDQYMEVYGANIGLGTRLKWPDTYFVFYSSLGWQTYELKDWNYYFIYSTGKSHNLSLTSTLSRNSTDQSIYPRQGSEFSFTMQLTPPWSLMRKNASSIDWQSKSIQDHFKWIEYNKWTFKGAVYTRLLGDLVLMTRAHFGYLGYYNRNWGYSPFEGFIVGGDGMSGYNTYGSEVIGLRGYENYSLTPYINGAYAGNVYDKFTVELRYPLIMQPSSTIYALAFLEAGNCWSDIHNFNPFQVKRSAGVGLRVFLPIVGLLGIDWGYGFDATSDKSQFHFVIGQQF